MRIAISAISFCEYLIQMANGLAGIGGPVFNHMGMVISAFAITGNPENISKRRDEIIEAVRYTSQQVSLQLGYTP